MPDPESPTPPPRRSWVVRLLRGGVFWATMLYATALALVLGGVAVIGERQAWLNLGLFVPPLAWLLPLLGLGPVALLLRPRLLLLQVACVALVLGLFLRPRWHRLAATAKPDLICVTNNIAQSHGLSLAPFVREEGADVVALQDASQEGPRLVAAFPQWATRTVDQFTLVSRFPILSGTPLHLPPEAGPVAVRFVLQLPGRQVALYDVRLPTPRNDLRRARYWLGKVRRDPAEIQDTELWEEYAQSLPKRMTLINELRAALRHERLPYVALGDFNTPSTGYNYRLLTGSMTDSFARVGQGYGLTFPSDLEHWVSLDRPWLRLDYIFAGPGVEPLYCRTEGGRRSEHRAVVAGLHFTPGAGSP